MAFADDLTAALDSKPDPHKGWEYRAYGTFEEWFDTALPLLKQKATAYEHHDSNGNVIESLDMPRAVKERLWRGEMAGVCAWHRGKVVKALLYRKIDATTFEFAWRHGSLAHSNFMRRIFWSMGFRNTTYLVTAEQIAKHEHIFGNPDEQDFVTEDEGQHKRVRIAWKKNPPLRTYDSSNTER